VGHGQVHGDALDLGLAGPDILGVLGRLHKGGGDDLAGTGPDQLDLAAQSGERLLVPGPEAALLATDGLSSPSALPSSSRAFRVNLAQARQLQFLSVVGELEQRLGLCESLAGGEALKVGSPREDLALQVFLGGQAPGLALGQKGDARRSALAARLEQQELLNRDLLAAVVGELAHGDQALFDDLGAAQARDAVVGRADP
jgi:hypothetical protein